MPLAAKAAPLESWDESNSTTLNAPRFTNAPSTSLATAPLTERPSNESAGPTPQSVDSLPLLPPGTTAFYPNQSKSGGQLNLTSTTTKYSTDLADKQTASPTGENRNCPFFLEAFLC